MADLASTSILVQEFLQKYRGNLDERAREFLEQSPPEVQQKVVTTFDPHQADSDYSRKLTSYIRSLSNEAGPGSGPSRKRPREDDDPLMLMQSIQPTLDLQQFRVRYPMDDRAFEFLSNSSSNVQAWVLREFRPRVEGESDYSSLITTLVKRARHGGVSVSGRTANGWQAHVRGGSIQELKDFRRKYPMDDRAWDFLNSASGETQEHVLSDFKPKVEGEADYSAIITSFIRTVEKSERQNGGSKGAPTRSQIEAFLARYPMDDRAIEFLVTSSPEVQREALRGFSPKALQDSDYSRPMTAYLRQVVTTVDPHQADPDGARKLTSYIRSLAHETGSTRKHRREDDDPLMLMQPVQPTLDLQQFRARYPMDDRAFEFLSNSSSNVQAWVLREFRPRVEGESDYSSLITTLVKRARHGGVDIGGRTAAGWQARVRGGSIQELKDFRRKYPMDDRAWDFLNSTSGETQDRVLSDFKPKIEGEADYSAIVTAFIRTVEKSERRSGGSKGAPRGRR